MKEILLTRGYVALVDDDDYERVMRFKWSTHVTSAGCVYAANSTAARECGSRLLHRFILNAAPGVEVDHKNRNGLDCRKSNMRLASRGQNSRNIGLTRKNKSGHKGVCWDKGRGLWAAAVRHNGKNIFIGRFSDKAEAARAYDRKAIELQGEFACLNFGSADGN